MVGCCVRGSECGGVEGREEDGCWACRGLEVWGSMVVLVFLNFYVFVNLRCCYGFGPNLDAFMDLLLSKRVHETLKHNSPYIYLSMNAFRTRIFVT